MMTATSRKMKMSMTREVLVRLREVEVVVGFQQWLEELLVAEELEVGAEEIDDDTRVKQSNHAIPESFSTRIFSPKRVIMY